MELKLFAVRLPEDLIWRLKVAAFEDRTTMQAIVIEAIEERLEKRNPAQESKYSGGAE
jgi:hypothetical protein